MASQRHTCCLRLSRVVRSWKECQGSTRSRKHPQPISTSRTRAEGFCFHGNGSCALSRKRPAAGRTKTTPSWLMAQTPGCVKCVISRRFVAIGLRNSASLSQLLLIRLTQHTPTGSVGACPGRRSRKPCGSSRASSRPRRLAERIWPGGDGQTGLCAHAADTGRPASWARYGCGSVPVAGTRLR